MNIEFHGVPTFSYETATYFVSITNVTPSHCFVQIEEYTGGMFFVTTDTDGEELWERETELVRQDFVSPEEAITMMITHFNTERPISIPDSYKFATVPTHVNYSTGLSINGEPVYVGQHKKSGECWPYIGFQFLAHLTQAAITPVSYDEVPF